MCSKKHNQDLWVNKNHKVKPLRPLLHLNNNQNKVVNLKMLCLSLNLFMLKKKEVVVIIYRCQDRHHINKNNK